MAWIESHTVLIRHRKLIELAKELRIRPVYALGHLHSLWHNALEQQEDGDLSSWSDELIAELSEFTGDAPQYVRLLQKHKWLEEKLIHDWLDYAGKYLTSKYRTSNPKRLKEIYKKHKTALSLTKDRLKSAHLTLPNLPNLTKPDKKGFAPPTLQDVKDYFLDLGVTGKDAEKFFDYHTSKGWVVGKVNMKDWQAAGRTWIRNSSEWNEKPKTGKQTAEEILGGTYAR